MEGLAGGSLLQTICSPIFDLVFRKITTPYFQKMTDNFDINTQSLFLPDPKTAFNIKKFSTLNIKTRQSENQQGFYLSLWYENNKHLMNYVNILL